MHELRQPGSTCQLFLAPIVVGQFCMSFLFVGPAGWLSGGLAAGWLAAGKMAWGLASWLAGWLAVLLAGWLAGCLAGWLYGWLGGWVAGWLAAGCLAGWPAGWQDCRLTGWLAGLLAGLLFGLPWSSAGFLFVRLVEPSLSQNGYGHAFHKSYREITQCNMQYNTSPSPLETLLPNHIWLASGTISAKHGQTGPGRARHPENPQLFHPTCHFFFLFLKE
jgi:hypothetical protein